MSAAPVLESYEIQERPLAVYTKGPGYITVMFKGEKPVTLRPGDTLHVTYEVTEGLDLTIHPAQAPL